MNRRRFLRTTGLAGAAILTGCLGTAQSDEGSPTPAVTDTSFEVTGVGSGSTTQTATVAWESPLTVTGTTTGNNGCYTAELAAVTYDPPGLEVVVRAFEPDDADMCTQALVAIDYEATVSVTGGGPGRVVVTHDSMGERQQVTTASRPDG